MTNNTSKKKLVIEHIFDYCQRENNYTFDNELVKKFCAKEGFKNPFDVTKLDNTSILPPVLLENDYFISHLGKGRHCFVRGIENGYHAFEEITDIRSWKYRKSLLNEFDTSESNILSVASNQLIIHDFLYENITKNPKVYNARRTKCSFSYKIGQHSMQMDRLQMEIDLTMECDNQVTIFEGKNNFPENFAVYQLYHPFLYYHELKENNQLGINFLNCCYLLRKKTKNGSIIRVYLYTFTDPYDMSSIKLIKSAEYKLVSR
ncbi:MAG: hypothetical protein K0U52_10960 [Gammaproteobacteria bacterium]|nr:hypothetical protein [Gammaproteobacteria bacterium]